MIKISNGLWSTHLVGLIFRYHNNPGFKAIWGQGLVSMIITGLTDIILCQCNEIDWKITCSDGKEDWRMKLTSVGRKRAKLTWLDHMQPVIYRSYDHDIIIAFPLRHELRQTCRYECSLVKNLPTHLGDWKGKPGEQWEYPSPIGKLMNLKSSCY